MYRYDLLCLEGLVQALRIFKKADQIPTYTLADVSKESMLKMHVKPEVLVLGMKKYHFFSWFSGFGCSGEEKKGGWDGIVSLQMAFNGL